MTFQTFKKQCDITVIHEVVQIQGIRFFNNVTMITFSWGFSLNKWRQNFLYFLIHPFSIAVNPCWVSRRVELVRFGNLLDRIYRSQIFIYLTKCEVKKYILKLQWISTAAERIYLFSFLKKKKQQWKGRRWRRFHPNLGARCQSPLISLRPRWQHAWTRAARKPRIWTGANLPLKSELFRFSFALTFRRCNSSPDLIFRALSHGSELKLLLLVACVKCAQREITGRFSSILI